MPLKSLNKLKMAHLLGTVFVRNIGLIWEIMSSHFGYGGTFVYTGHGLANVFKIKTHLYLGIFILLYFFFISQKFLTGIF